MRTNNRFPGVLQPLVLSLAVAFSGSAFAQSAMTDVVVTATRSSQSADQTVGTVTTIDQDEIERRQAADIGDLFRDEPDISTTNDMRRFGTAGINIRGIEDNRVLLLVDGVRATDYRSPGTTNYDAANRDLPEVDFLKRAEIVRGPGSSLYGSDAIGGVVGFLTLDPEDFLVDGKSSALGAKLSHFTANEGTKATGWLAAGGQMVKGLLMVSRYDAKETETQGNDDSFGFDRTKANPEDSTAVGVLAKLVVDPAPGHQFRLGIEAKEKQTDTDVQRISNRSATSPNTLTRITENLGDDELKRHRVSLDHIYAPSDGWFDRVSSKLYWQRQETNDKNYQRRSNASLNATWGCSATTPGAGNCDVDQEFVFEQSHTGVSSVVEKTLRGSLPQFITGGFDWIRTTTQEVKYATWTNLATGVSSNQFLGESFPKSDFPKGHMDQFGVFLQDELQFADGRLVVTPGLRYDEFNLKPDDDALYTPLAGASVNSGSGSRVSPKLAASFEVVSGARVYGQYVEGYRAPNYEQVNRRFLQNQQFYAVIGNGDLKPETSKGTEIGVKVGGKDLGAQLAVFRNTYDDFIDSVRLATGDPAIVTGYTTFQYRNLQNVSIHGHELRGHWQALSVLRLSAAYAYAWGEYESATAPGTYEPLNSIEPRRFSLNVLWTPTDDWAIESRLRAARHKDRTDDTSGELYRTDGYAVVDLSARWQVRHNTRINLAVNNLFDRKYILWSDVRKAGVPASDGATDFYTQPGRNYSASLTMEF